MDPVMHCVASLSIGLTSNVNRTWPGEVQKCSLQHTAVEEAKKNDEIVVPRLHDGAVANFQDVSQ